jgi:hypothetical protein
MMMGLVCPGASRTHIYANRLDSLVVGSGASIHPPRPEGRKQRLARLGLSRAWLPHDIYADMPCAGMMLSAGIAARLT